MKKGFSLIEIIQTVVLLGIIAGLSISFFKNVNVDRKIYDRTVTLLRRAEIEVQKQICTDDTLVCDLELVTGIPGIADYPAGDDMRLNSNIDNQPCALLATQPLLNNNNLSYNSDGYCCYPSNGGVCTAAPQGLELYEIDSNCCYPPACIYSSIVADANGVNQVNDVYRPANIIAQAACPDGNANYAYKRRAANGNIENITELCRRLHGMINHKPQTRFNDKDVSDLDMTCNHDNAWMAHNMDPCISAANGGTCGATIADGVDNTNNVHMILPNGARIYGLNNDFTTLPQGDANAGKSSLTVYIKYDRIGNVSTVKVGNAGDDGVNTTSFTFNNPWTNPNPPLPPAP